MLVGGNDDNFAGEFASLYRSVLCLGLFDLLVIGELPVVTGKLRRLFVNKKAKEI